MPSRPERAGAGLPLVLLVVLVIALPSGGSSSTSVSSPAGSAAPPVSHSYPSPIRHVVVVAMENRGYGTISSSGFVRYLMAHGVWFTRYYALCHPSAPNYIARTSGVRKQCGSDAVTNYSLTNVVNLLHHAGLGWRAYLEDMSGRCETTNSPNGLYVARHNPFVFYADVRHNLTGSASSISCANDVPMTPLIGKFTSRSVQPYTWVTPDVVDDCHNGAVASCLAWLERFLNPFLNATATSGATYNDTVFLVSFDEATGNNSGYNGTVGGHAVQILVGSCALIDCGHNLTSDSSGYNVLTTTECLLGLDSLGKGHNDSYAKWPPFTAAFAPGLHLSCAQPPTVRAGHGPSRSVVLPEDPARDRAAAAYRGVASTANASITVRAMSTAPWTRAASRSRARTGRLRATWGSGRVGRALGSRPATARERATRTRRR